MQEFFNWELDEIISITDLGIVQDEVYDVGMTDTPHTFFANGILVHNSCFLSASDILNKVEKSTDKQLTFDEKVILTNKTASAVELYINNSFSNQMVSLHNANKHTFSIKQEYVSEAAFWVAKKRYGQKIITEKGVTISQLTNGKKTWKLDVKGLDIVRSNFAKSFRNFMSDILIKILDGKPKADIDLDVKTMRSQVHELPIIDIASPTGIKDINKYNLKHKQNEIFYARAKGTPIHVKSALNHNDIVTYNGLTDFRPLSDGDKIKWVYLKDNPYKIETIAFRGYDDPEVIMELVDKYIDREKTFESSLQKKLEAYYDAMNWGDVIVNDNVTEFFSFN